MKRNQRLLIIIFSIVVLKYNLSAFVQPLSFENIPDSELTSEYRPSDTHEFDESTLASL